MSKYALKKKTLICNYYRKIDLLIAEIKKYVFFNLSEKKLMNLIVYLVKKLDIQKINVSIKSEIKRKLKVLKFYALLDLTYYKESDPACQNYDDIILAYPGYYCVLCYRIAHILYNLDIQHLPRIITEYAHSKTGIDISPGAEISHHFFIDHGTGVVIGETARIGHHVKIYQGVTLGALSLKKGSQLKGKKRHPTIKNFVTIYANSAILGGDTVINNNVTIGSNIVVKESVEENYVLINNNDKYQLICKNK